MKTNDYVFVEFCGDLFVYKIKIVLRFKMSL